MGDSRVGLADLDLVLNPAVTLPVHPNGLTVTATLDDGATVAKAYLAFRVGSVLQEGETADNLPRSTGPKRATIGPNERVLRPKSLTSRLPRSRFQATLGEH